MQNDQIPNSDEFYNSIEMFEVKDQFEAVGRISTLVHFDERFARQPFSLVLNDILGSTMTGQYVIAGKKISKINQQTGQQEQSLHPIAALLWANLDPTIAVVRANNIRPLAPIEYNSGSVGFFTLFTSPFEQPDKMIEVIRKKSTKLQQLPSINFVDKLFKPDYNFRTDLAQ